jgi:hypothetical protein
MDRHQGRRTAPRRPRGAACRPPEFALDDNAIEVLRESKAVDLRSLSQSGPIGRHAQADAPAAEVLDCLDGAGKRAEPLFSRISVGFGDFASDVRAV